MVRIALSLLALLIPCAVGLSIRGPQKGPLELERESFSRTPTSVVVWKRNVKGSFSALSDRDKYVVLAVYCGRRDRMELMMKHAKTLLKKGEIDEIHLHVMHTKTAEDDQAWIAEQAEDDESITPYAPNRFQDPYDFYANDWKPVKKFEGKTVIVKADDDVVYVDEENFGKFTDYIKDHSSEMFIVFANTVNNGVSAYYQQQHGSIPKESNGVDMNMEYPYEQNWWPGHDGEFTAGLKGSLWETGSKTTELHNIFLKDPKSFSWKAWENDGCIAYRHPDHKESQGRFSVNFFGWTYDKSAQIAELVGSHDGDDEHALTTDNPNQNCMFTEFVVSHLSFFQQLDNGMNATEVLQKYYDHAGMTMG